MTYVALATEDALSEAIGQRLLSEAALPLQVGPALRRNGAGYLQSSVHKWRALAELQPMLLLTDLDKRRCPSALIEKWFGTRALPPSLLVRVAVREVESWLLADHEGFAALLGRSVRLPADPDGLPDPKRELLNLAARARRDVRNDLVADVGAIARQGLGYNTRLCAFVAADWSPARAAKRSNSLHRARLRIDELAERLPSD